MRPLLVDLGRDYRGGQDQALLLLKGLAAGGHAPMLITIRGSLLAERAHAAGICVKVVDKRWRRLSATLAIRKLISQHAVDIIHANEPHALTSTWLAKARRNVPLVASRRVIFPLSTSAISLSRYRAADKIIAVSQCVSSALVNSGMRPEKIAVIHDGVPSECIFSLEDREQARQSLGIDAGAQLIGCVAAFTPDKGQELLVQAFAKIREKFPNWQLVLTGDGPCRAKLNALVHELSLSGAVHFTGFVEDIQRVYAAIDIFAFLAQEEALGTALLLAMASGLPVITCARGGIPEVVENEKNGLSLTNQNPETVAAAIERLIVDPEFAANLGTAASEIVLTRFSQDHMVKETLSLYEQLLATHSSRA